MLRWRQAMLRAVSIGCLSEAENRPVKPFKKVLDTAEGVNCACAGQLNEHDAECDRAGTPADERAGT